MKIEIITTKEKCNGCTIMKNILDQYNVEYKEYKIEDIPWYKRTSNYATFSGWPHFIVDGEIKFNGTPHPNQFKRQLINLGILHRDVLKGR